MLELSESFISARYRNFGISEFRSFGARNLGRLSVRLHSRLHKNSIAKLFALATTNSPAICSTMGKRKREADPPKEAIPALLSQRIAVGKTALAKSLKQAQRFERQKLGRLQKTGTRSTRKTSKGKKEKEHNPVTVIAEIEALNVRMILQMLERQT